MSVRFGMSPFEFSSVRVPRTGGPARPPLDAQKKAARRPSLEPQPSLARQTWWEVQAGRVRRDFPLKSGVPKRESPGREGAADPERGRHPLPRLTLDGARPQGGMQSSRPRAVLARQFSAFAGVGLVSAVVHYGALVGLVEGFALGPVPATLAGYVPGRHRLLLAEPPLRLPQRPAAPRGDVAFRAGGRRGVRADRRCSWRCSPAAGACPTARPGADDRRRAVLELHRQPALDVFRRAAGLALT